MTKPLSQIETPENMRLHRIGWRAQKVFRGILVLFIILAAAGGMGTGFLSEREQRFGTDLIVRCERITRIGTETELEVESLTGNPDKLVVLLPYNTLSRYQLESISPEPMHQASMPEGVRYEFVRQAGSRIVFSFSAEKPGMAEGTLTIGNNAFNFSQFIFP
jgi:hypothetical protein